MTLGMMADSIVVNTQKYVGAENFFLLMRGTNTGFRNSEIVVYRTVFDGVSYINANTVYVGRNETVQFITSRAGNDLQIEDRTAHVTFLQGLALIPDF
jgi:hypothetical protein